MISKSQKYNLMITHSIHTIRPQLKSHSILSMKWNITGGILCLLSIDLCVKAYHIASNVVQ